MREKILKVLRKFIRILSKKPKKFKKYNEALEYCKKFTSNVYEQDILCKYRFENLSAYLSRNESLLLSPMMPFLLFVINNYIKENHQKCPKILDFGGACGESVIMLQKIFGDQIYQNSWILESPQMAEESKKWDFAKNINFISSIDQVSNNDIDIFFTSGTIHCFEKPLDIIEKAAVLEIPIIALTRNFFSLKKITFANSTTLSGNALGTKPLKGYGNPTIYYPFQTIDKKELISLLKKYGYDLKFETFIPRGSPNPVGETNLYGGELLFVKS